MTSLLTGLALCFPLRRANSPSLGALPRAVPLSHLRRLRPFLFLYCSLPYPHAPSRPRYRIARTSMHRWALSRARVRAHSRSRTLSTDCLRSLVEFNDLSDHTVSLYLASVDPRGRLPASSRSFSLVPPLSLSLSLSRTRALAPSIAMSLASLIATDTSYLVLSLPASRPFLLSSFPPFLPPIDSSCFCALLAPPFFAAHVPSSVATLGRTSAGLSSFSLACPFFLFLSLFLALMAMPSETVSSGNADDADARIGLYNVGR